MNQTTMDILSSVEFLNSSDYLMHYGKGHLDGGHSGRYPWGSGKDPNQRSDSMDWLSRVERYHKEGYSEKEIAEMFNLTTKDFRAYKEVAKDNRRSDEYARIVALQSQGYNATQIAKELGYKSESSIRNIIDAQKTQKKAAARNTADYLMKRLDETDGAFIEIGQGVARELGLNSEEKFYQAVEICRNEYGCEVFKARVEQSPGSGKFTTITVLAPEGSEARDVYSKKKEGLIKSAVDYEAKKDSEGNDIFVKRTFEFPASLDSSRLTIKYAEDGGELKDGVIELRRGVKDLDLNGAAYAQVRIMVDGTHYLKGMAVYSDDIPDGYDVMFNTNKHKDKTKMEVLKECKKGLDKQIDRDNPFGALLKEDRGQSTYIDDDGVEKLSLINKTREEGDWGKWADKLPAQFLSKQPQKLIDRQLQLTMENKKAEYDDICALENGTLKRKLLRDFADGCDSDAVKLKAVALPGQKYQVILPLTTIGDNEIYAPNYKDGDTVALIRYPHGGTFEIPILKVNNKNAEGDSMITRTAKDAVGISKKTADRLSGADFDGDTVQVIPCNSYRSSTKIRSTSQLKDLEGFDPKAEYGTHSINGQFINNITGLKCSELKKGSVGTEMGKISNLITDMTLQGAPESELARAVRHSMVVIDANKHHLDYKQSYKDNGIDELVKTYQVKGVDENGKTRYGGASTLISRSKSEERVLKTKGTDKINQKGKDWYDPSKPEGALIKNYVEETYVDKNGKQQVRTTKTTKMALADDARTLMSGPNHEGTIQEKAYAEYANYMKSLANSARIELTRTKEQEYNPSAKRVYSEEVASLDAKLRISESNKPRERQALLIRDSIVAAKKEQYPDLYDKENKDQLKKIQTQALNQAREQVGAHRTTIEITDSEWEAIQAGAVSPTKVSRILDYADGASVRERATPKNKNNEISVIKQNKIASMKALGYTNAEIAEIVDVSVSTVQKY